MLNNYQEENLLAPESKDDESIAIVYQHLSKLEDTEQSMIINKHIHQMTFAQLSNLYQMPIPTIQSKIYTILSKIKTSIEKAGFAGVALALASTLDQLKASELSTDLLPKIKEYFPKTYPQPISEKLNKLLIKPKWLVFGVFALFITYASIAFLTKQNDLPASDVTKKTKSITEEIPKNSINTAIDDKNTDKNEKKSSLENAINIQPTSLEPNVNVPINSEQITS